MHGGQRLALDATGDAPVALMAAAPHKCGLRQVLRAAPDPGVDYTGTGTPTDESHSYDDAGNRTNTGYTTGDHNRLTADGTYTYQYDANGNRTVRTKVSDGTLTEYGWDHRNRLTSVTFKTSGGTVTKAVQYEYDAYNRP
ncbi:MAG: DUF5103 domain-containing protein [Chloroflexi bacterium]|nr:DUF5103 domain-containing protein [Chloroflexota bacterium]